jgi:hypothetical protein
MCVLPTVAGKRAVGLTVTPVGARGMWREVHVKGQATPSALASDVNKWNQWISQKLELFIIKTAKRPCA